MTLNPLEWLRAFSTIDRLWGLEAKHTAIIEAQKGEIQSLKDRVSKLEAREDVLIAEAKGAAASAASAAVAQNMMDLARRVGALEERAKIAGSGRSPGIEGSPDE